MRNRMIIIEWFWMNELLYWIFNLEFIEFIYKEKINW